MLLAVIDAPFALALAAGVIAAFNPCGFAMLPAYISVFVGLDPTGRETSRIARVARAIVVAGAVTAGFMAVFGLLGLLISEARVRVYEYVPWVTGVIAVALIVFGIAMTMGYEPRFNLPKIGITARSSTSLWSMAVYGVSYATVSLSCTLPTFIALTATTFDDRSVVSGIAVYFTYAAGMGMVLLALSVALAVAQHAFVRGMRRFLAVVSRASGILLALTGAYLLWYAFYAYRTVRGDGAPQGPVAVVTKVSSEISTWIQNLGSTWLIAALVVTVVFVTATLILNRIRRLPHREIS